MNTDHSGFDPQLRRYFRKIVNTTVFLLLWVLAASMAGLYYQLALPVNGWRWQNAVFYLLLFASLFLLIRFLYRTWK